ncbi:MAG: polyprenyl synthetase family protein [Duncaniella sp.]|nr:polyprenyl synthetase family protein [Duncaniella sp.]
MTSVSDIRASLGEPLERVNTLISESLHSANPLMSNVIESYLKHKGKQLRPMMVLLTARMLGEINDRAIAGAASIEILHNASLIHDDVVDNSDLRHGQPTINAIWDNHIAVLVGDYFVSTSLRLAMQTRSMSVVETIASLGRLLSLGEMDQIYNARYHTLSEEAYYEVISHKTASLFVSCVEMGCYCCGVTEGPRFEALREYARIFGLCFQIKDDIFDYFSDPAVGKPTGNDLREGKVTLPLLHVLAKSEEMRGLVEKGGLTDEEIAELIEFAKANGGIEYAEATLERLHREAAEALSVFPDTEGRQDLLTLLSYIIKRDY